MVMAKDQFPDFTKGELSFGMIKKFQYEKKLKDELKAGLTKEQALQLYHTMLYNRSFEEMIIALRSGEFVPFGLCLLGAVFQTAPTTQKYWVAIRLPLHKAGVDP